MKILDILYSVLTAPIYFFGFVIGLLGILLTGLGDVMMGVWDQYT
jgi:hypothetical protein